VVEIEIGGAIARVALSYRVSSWCFLVKCFACRGRRYIHAASGRNMELAAVLQTILQREPFCGGTSERFSKSH
jgi:hypothetical protein